MSSALPFDSDDLLPAGDSPPPVAAMGSLIPPAAREAELVACLAACAAGDESALVTLYAALACAIHAFARLRLKTPDLAEDVVVETMYEVWRHAGRFSGRSRVSSWVLGIARHKVLGHLRRAGKFVFQPLDCEAEAIADEHPDGYELVADRQQAAQVAACLDALPEVQRECLRLVFFDELSLAEIAEIQGCPENTVKTRLFHARRKLKESLGHLREGRVVLQ